MGAVGDGEGMMKSDERFVWEGVCRVGVYVQAGFWDIVYFVERCECFCHGSGSVGYGCDVVLVEFSRRVDFLYEIGVSVLDDCAWLEGAKDSIGCVAEKGDFAI